jgi:hypothetical protein
VLLLDAPGGDACLLDCSVGPGVTSIIGFFLVAGDELQTIGGDVEMERARELTGRIKEIMAVLWILFIAQGKAWSVGTMASTGPDAKTTVRCIWARILMRAGKDGREDDSVEL